MNLKLYDTNKKDARPLLNISGLHIEENFNSVPSMEFDISLGEQIAAYIKTEGYIETEEGWYVIKEVVNNGESLNVYAIGDVEELKGARVFEYELNDSTIIDAINFLLSMCQEHNWTVRSHTTITRKRSTKNYKSNAFDILMELVELFHIEIKFDTKSKVIHVYNYNEMGSYGGQFFIDSLNLENLEIETDTDDFATLIYPYGAQVNPDASTEEGRRVNITSVNDGKYYLADYTYSKKRIRYYWVDDRYKVPANLKEDGEFLLAEMSKPKISYKAKIRDLAAISNAYRGLTFGLGDTVRIISQKNNIDIEQRVIKIDKYPFEPEKNSIELSTRSKSFADKQALRRKFVDKVYGSVSSDGSINRISDSSIDGDKVIIDGTVGGSKIKDAAIGSAKIEDAAITSAKIGTAQISTAHINDAAITKAKIADASISTAKIEHGAINTAQIGTAAVTSANIATAAITNALIQNGAIDTAKIADASITTAKIEVGAITSALIENGAIGTAQIADGSITDAKIIGLTANKITSGTIDAADINVINLNAANITVGSINGQQIASGTISLDNLSQTVIDAMSSSGGTKVYFQSTAPTNANEGDLWYNTASGNKLHQYTKTGWVAYQFGSNALSANSILAEHITSGAITTGKIASGAITTNQLAVGAVTGEKIAGTTITGDKIATGAISANQIASNAITTDKIAANAVTAAKIASKTITANEIASNTISSAQIATNGIKASNIDVSDLFSTNITATNMNITGGSIEIMSADSADSTIYLVYGNDFMNLGASGVCWGNYSDNNRVRINKDSISVQDSSSTTSIEGSYIWGKNGNFSGTLDVTGRITCHSAILPNSNNSIMCGTSSNRWSTLYTDDINVSGNTEFSGGKIKCQASYDGTTSYAANGYVGTSGYFSRSTKTSSRTIKHDIKRIENQDLLPSNLYDLNVYQFKYNNGIITDKEDVRYGVDMVGFIIEEMNEVYPIAVDKPSDNPKDWSWNEQYLIPPMLQLIKEQKKQIDNLEERIKVLEGC